MSRIDEIAAQIRQRGPWIHGSYSAASVFVIAIPLIGGNLAIGMLLFATLNFLFFLSLLVLSVSDIRKGDTWCKGANIPRNRRPVLFWFWVIIPSAGVAAITAACMLVACMFVGMRMAL